MKKIHASKATEVIQEEGAQEEELEEEKIANAVKKLKVSKAVNIDEIPTEGKHGGTEVQL